ncbi:sugar ABC transporter ATP-binding protein [Leucobacter rhizosphaerae]|uniref:Sugar ABC transporter ATP-binding protein n=1 Tax=Leucobacter rhizosphaerae TaxID=2932245 RepID=A0ABY4FU05_9MICO|nr:sugar ABC transporter ATP-binding protein [Leucobacter rhizosphaerae]UOQ59742.1 sugar ABC transporter ATP-binding protein [Leucobacter rhizosphaerae]
MTADLPGASHAMPRLSFDGVSVRFGSTLALDGIDLEIPAGQIVGLLGHNGAGKSTLLNVATGAVSATSGTMALDGVPTPPRATPKDIAELGVTVIHQEPALAGNLSILDNLFLARGAGVSRPERVARGREALDTVGGGHLPLDAPVNALSLGERQLVDLARGLLIGDMRVLLLDEPTAALGEAETRALHQLIRDLAAKGTTVVYVSHRLPDIVDVCERIVVLRGGRSVMDASTVGMSAAELSRALAPEVQLESDWTPTVGESRLSVDHAGGTLEFSDGEIVGLYGMAAGEQFRLLDTLFGLSGDVTARLSGRPYRVARPTHAVRQGVHLVPADRETDGLIGGLSAKDNTFLPWFARGWRSRQKISTAYESIRETLNVHGPDGDAPIMSYSGGNRQKHLLARWMIPVAPKVLLLAQPTQGVDVGAKQDIRVALRTLADTGVCILVASAETDEIASMCDRSYVLAHGQHREIFRSGAYEADLLATLLDLTPAGDLHS